jgi:hypothetical protein
MAAWAVSRTVTSRLTAHRARHQRLRQRQVQTATSTVLKRLWYMTR